jgi:para-aminobenzoate synthetase
MKTLIIDNYDSFTYNLYQLVGSVLGEAPVVRTNDQLSWDEFLELSPNFVILSPGPGRPDIERDFGICRRVLLESEVPVLGVCLGHQGLGQVYGGRVVAAPEPMHGRTSIIQHDGSDIFAGIPQGLHAVRYHSLIVATPVPDCLRVTAWTEDGLVMGLAHKDRPLWGVQFHPESIATEHGERLMRNFLGIAEGAVKRQTSKARVNPPARTSWKVFSRRLAGVPDPETTFCSLFGTDSPAFWLDSSDSERSRFSFMGTGTLVPETPALFDYLRHQIYDRACAAPELPFDFVGGFVGYLGYEMKALCGGAALHRSSVPDWQLMFVDRFVAFDRLHQTVYLVYAGPAADFAAAKSWLDALEERFEEKLQAGLSKPAAPEAAEAPAAGGPPVFTLEQSRAEYLSSIEECLRLIREGESYEVCLTNRLRAATSVDPLAYYRVLRRMNPAPHSAFLRFPEVSVACSSPERFLRVDRAGNAESRPIKGTARRGANAEEDEQLKQGLHTSVKTRAENLMIVDLLRNDLGRVCEIGSVRAPQMMEVETYSSLHQLVSIVRGRLRAGATAVDCLRAAFPGGSMTGAPKIRTMEILDRLERSARGIYSGTIGFLSLNGAADLNIVIRTAVFASGEVSIGIGGAIVALSDPEAEFEEAVLKGRRLMDAFTGFREVNGPREKSFQESMADPKQPERPLP